MDQHTTLVEKIANAPVIAAAGGALVFGYRLPDIAAAVTIVYTLLLMYLRLRKEYKKWKARREAKNSGLPLPAEDLETDRGGL